MSIQPGTQRITALLSRLPALTAPVVHLAGTNGKGSVSAILDAILTTAGLTTGRFNSPHLVSVEDAIRLSGQPIDRVLYETTRAEVEHVDKEAECGASLFELLTATALVVFARAGVDVVLVECGMGGRDDATNVFSPDQVLACALTSVELDHQAFLGETVEQIAQVKAEIVKPDGVLVIGLQKHENAVKQVVDRLAAERRATVVWADQSLIGSTSAAAPAGSQPVLTPLPKPLADGPPFAGADVSDALALLQAELVQLMEDTSPLLAAPSSSDDDAGPTPATLLPVIENIARLSTAVRSFARSPRPWLKTDLPLPGQHQRDNLSLALAVIHVLRSRPAALDRLPALRRLTDDVVARGVIATIWEGRCSWLSLDVGPSSDRRQCEVLADGAHNAASASLLATYLDTLPPRPTYPGRTFILSLSHSPPKSPADVLAPLLRTGDRVALVEFSTPIEGMPWIRPVPIDDLIEPVRALIGDEAPIWAGKLEDALAWAADQGRTDGSTAAAGESGENKREQGLVVVAGSLYLVADLYRFVRRGGGGGGGGGGGA